VTIPENRENFNNRSRFIYFISALAVAGVQCLRSVLECSTVKNIPEPPRNRFSQIPPRIVVLPDDIVQHLTNYVGLRLDVSRRTNGT
jgi:hypothetical protein